MLTSPPSARWHSAAIQARLHAPAFGRHGKKVVIALCGWEILALTALPIPTLSATVRRYPSVGWLILGLLGHHWFLEAAELAVDVIVTATED